MVLHGPLEQFFTSFISSHGDLENFQMQKVLLNHRELKLLVEEVDTSDHLQFYNNVNKET